MVSAKGFQDKGLQEEARRQGPSKEVVISGELP
jgi:hypothetical protein